MNKGFGTVSLIICAMVAGAAAAGDLHEVSPAAAPDLTSRSSYDPVAHALAIGLTPSRADAKVDAGFQTAESCPLIFDTRKPIPHCWEGVSQVGS